MAQNLGLLGEILNVATRGNRQARETQEFDDSLKQLLTKQQAEGKIKNQFEIDKIKATQKAKDAGAKLDVENKADLFKRNLISKQQNLSPLEQLIERGGAADAAKILRNEELFNTIAGGEQQGAVGQQGIIPQQNIDFQGQFRPPTIQEEAVGQSFERPDLFATEAKFGDFGKLEPSKIKSESGIKRAKKVETSTAESVKQSFKLTGEFVKANRNFLRTTALFSGIVAQLQGKKAEQGGLGLVQGSFGKLGTTLKVPGFGRTASFTGQLDETAIGLNSVLTGQNRVIKSVVEMIRGTLPSEFDTDDFAAAKIAQSITNSFKLNKSFELGLLSPQSIEDLSAGDENFDLESRLNQIIELSPEEKSNLEKMISGILETPATKSRKLGKQPKDVKSQKDQPLTIGGQFSSKQQPFEIFSVEKVK